MHFLQAINSDPSVLIVCNKTGGTIKGDIKKKFYDPKFVRRGGLKPRNTTISTASHCYKTRALDLPPKKQEDKSIKCGARFI